LHFLYPTGCPQFLYLANSIHKIQVYIKCINMFMMIVLPSVGSLGVTGNPNSQNTSIHEIHRNIYCFFLPGVRSLCSCYRRRGSGKTRSAPCGKWASAGSIRKKMLSQSFTTGSNTVLKKKTHLYIYTQCAPCG